MNQWSAGIVEEKHWKMSIVLGTQRSSIEILCLLDLVALIKPPVSVKLWTICSDFQFVVFFITLCRACWGKHVVHVFKRMGSVWMRSGTLTELNKDEGSAVAALSRRSHHSEGRRIKGRRRSCTKLDVCMLTPQYKQFVAVTTAVDKSLFYIYDRNSNATQNTTQE